MRILGLEDPLDQGWENYSLLAKSRLPPVAVNTVLLEPSHTQALKYRLWPSHTPAGLSASDSDYRSTLL